MLNMLLDTVEYLLFGYVIDLPSEEWQQKLKETADKGGSWEDFL